MTHDPQFVRSELPFSRPLVVTEVPAEGLDLSISANVQERAALAEADELPELSRLEADLRVARRGPGGLAISGELRADMRRVCVVTLEEFETSLVAPIDIRFAPSPTAGPAHRDGAQRGEETRTGHVDWDEETPDPLIDGRIDLGEVVSEFLALNLDPYPRKPGASFIGPETAASSVAESPFAGLRSALERGPKAD